MDLLRALEVGLNILIQEMLLERDSSSVPDIVHHEPMSADHDPEGRDSVIIALKQMNSLPPTL